MADSTLMPRVSQLPGPRGPRGAAGSGSSGTNGVSAFTTTTASFVMPAAAAQVTVSVASSAPFVAGQPLFVEDAGHFTLTTILSSTALRLTAQSAAGNASAGATIASGKKVVVGALLTVDPSVTNALDSRITTLESASGGFLTFHQYSTPTASHVGDIWFQTDITGAYTTGQFRWDGSSWVDVKSALASGDFGSGVRPVIYSATFAGLPNSAVGTLAFANDTAKLYRKTGTGWVATVASGDITGTIDGSTLAADSIAAGKLAYGLAIGDKLSASDVIIRHDAQIADATISSAKITDLDAGKITTGNLVAVNMGHSGYIFHTDYPTKFFRSTHYNSISQSAFSFGSGSAFAFTNPSPCIAYTPGHASWGASGSVTACPNPANELHVYLEAALIGYTGTITLYYRKNDSGSYIALASRNSSDAGNAYISCNRVITGIAATDKLSFYVAPCDGTGNLSTPVTCRYELDVTAFNW